MRLPAILIALAVTSASAATEAPPGADLTTLIEAGRRIYMEGVLPSGEPLRGRRDGNIEVSGTEAACVLCHRRSGMGAAEGQKPVPPIVGAALFAVFRLPGARSPRRAPGIEFHDFDFRVRPPYDAATLARALREGISTSGHRFQYMMPRYELGDQDLQAVIAYLQAMPTTASSGADTPQIHLATVITPDADAKDRRSFLPVLKACIDDRQPAHSVSQHTGDGWQLHVWELNGPADSWETQLQAHYARQPVFAMVSGLGRDEWGPVHRFCENQRIPCLFPNTDLPGAMQDSVYNFYFFRGVLLEADALASHLIGQREKLGIDRIVQVTRARGAGAEAAVAFRKALANTAIPIENRLWPPDDAAIGDGTANGLLRDLTGGDALVLWLRAEDVADLVKRIPTPPAHVAIFLSGAMSGLEAAPLPTRWRKKGYLVYPVDAPGRWEQRARFNLRPWLARQGIKSEDERLQGNTLAACTTFAEAMYRTQGLRLRDYLVETVEATASSMGNAGATTAFPRFIIGTNQRFASKGAYIVRFAEPKGQRIEKVSNWIVP